MKAETAQLSKKRGLSAMIMARMAKIVSVSFEINLPNPKQIANPSRCFSAGPLSANFRTEPDYP